MSYKDSAKKVAVAYENVSETVGFIRDLKFETNWKGQAKEAIGKAINDIASDFDSLGTQISSFSTALTELEKYKTQKEKITSLRKTYNGLPNTKLYNRRRNNLSSQISSLVSDNKILRKSIESKLSSITELESINLTSSNFQYLISSDGKYIVDVKELLAKFQNGTLTKIADGDSLYNYISEAEVDQLLKNIQSQYQGRYLAVNSALGIVDMAASKNLKLDYDWGGGHVQVTDVDHVATGTDCSAFVSWAINQGSKGTFTTRTTSGLINVGKTVNYEQAKEGDILVYNNGSGGHVVMIVDNDIQNQTFTVVEANGSNKGVILQTKKYSSLKGNNYQAKDLSEYYGYTENEVETRLV